MSKKEQLIQPAKNDQLDFKDNGHGDNAHDNNGHKKTLELFKNEVDTLPIINKYLNVSYQDFQRIINDNNAHEKPDRDLEIIIDLLIDLAQSISVCQNTSPGYEFYAYHFLKIDSLNKVLKEFAWFEELKQNCPRFSLKQTSN